MTTDSLFADASILVTGGTGSFGRTFVALTLQKCSPKRIVIFSRDEMKQWEMCSRFGHDPRLSFIIGDVRDKDAITKALVGIDYVVHAAATKIVPTAEYNPVECIKTNINGAMNVIDACEHAGVKKVIALSTDKACNPVNLYGATKLASDKLFIASNSMPESIVYSVVRYGNVMGSRGSVIPLFLKQRVHGKITVTNDQMTRFMITLRQAVKLVWHAFEDSLGGEIYVKKIPSMTVSEIVRTIAPDAEVEVIGMRPGEKMHEQMISVEDAPNTFEYEEYYKILPQIHNWCADPRRIKDGVAVPEGFSYASDNNSHWMQPEDLKGWIEHYSPPEILSKD